MNVNPQKLAFAAALMGATGSLAGCAGGEDALSAASLAPAAPAAMAPQATGYSAAPQFADDTMPPPPSGPARYDTVGYAAVSNEGDLVPAISATHASLPTGSFIELTALESGKTIIVIITDGNRPRDGWLLNLSAGAARALGGEGNGLLSVRVRRIDPPGMDQAALREGRLASERIDAPPVLLRALRKRLPPSPRMMANDLPARPTVKSRSPKPVPGAPYAVPGTLTVRRSTPAVQGSGLFVQIAALSSPERANALAQSVDGSVQPGNGVYRVRIGPYADTASADRARIDMAQRGYADARIVRD